MKFALNLLFLLFLFSWTSFGQQLKPVYNWIKIEQSIKKRNYLNEVTTQLQKIEKETKKDKNDVEFTRSLYCQMLIRDLQTEDSLYFRNSAFIDTLLLSPKTGPVLKTLMHLMKARRLHLFGRKNLRFGKRNYETRDLANNYAHLETNQLDSLAIFHLDEAARTGSDLPVLQSDLRWLSSNPEVLLFKYDLEDIALAEKISISLFDVAGTSRAPYRTVADILAYDDQKIIASVSEVCSTLRLPDALSGAYKNWLHKHKNDSEIEGFVVAGMRGVIYGSNSEDSLIFAAHENYLLKKLNSPYKLVKANAVFQLIKIYVDKGQNYHRFYESRYKDGFKKALVIAQRYSDLFSGYSSYNGQVLSLVNLIRLKEIAVKMADKQIPGKALLLKVDYKNVAILHYRIVSLTEQEFRSVLKQRAGKKTIIRAGQYKSWLRNGNEVLPDPKDYNNHRTFVKLDGLSQGNYGLVFSYQDMSVDSVLVNVVLFRVTGLAAFNANDQVIVVDRKSGFPIKNARVSTTYHSQKNVRDSVKRDFSDVLGRVGRRNDQEGSMQIIHLQDTLMHYFSASHQEMPRDVFDKNEYDDLDEYYDDQTELQFYTDRGIYRPGQKVFFKAILVTKDPKTGKQVVFHKGFGRLLKHWLQENKPVLCLKDVQGKKVDSVLFVPDDYGSFSGAFVIPKAALPGEWLIEDAHVSSVDESGGFRVEEYKRPTYELLLEKPIGPTFPGEAFDLKIKARSFSGANLKGVRVAYKLTRRADNRDLSELADTVCYTNEKGELLIHVEDQIFRESGQRGKSWTDINYRLSAVATDDSAEETKLEGEHLATRHLVSIRIGMNDFYRSSVLPSLKVSATSENKRYDGDSLRVEIYAIEKESYGSDKVDEWKYPLTELRKVFSAEEMGMEYRSVTKRTLVYTDLIHPQTGLLRLDHAKLSSGSYELIVKSRKENQVYGVFFKEFLVFDEQLPKSEQLRDAFVKMPVNAYKPGETVSLTCYFPDSTYLVTGISYYAKNSRGLSIRNILKTTIYSGGVLHEYRFTIPSNTDKNLVFNYAYVQNGIIYKGDINLYIIEPTKEIPEIIVEKYRKILAPGAQETFSVSIKTNDRNTAAELLTTLYDASLDKLASHSFAGPKNERYNGHRIRGSWSQEISNAESAGVYDIDPAQSYSLVAHRALQGSLSGMSIRGSESLKLDEVAVTLGYLDYTGSRVVHGFSTATTLAVKQQISLMDYIQPLIIVDGEVFEGNLKDFDASQLVEGLVFKGADAVAWYGAKAASGVLVISTKGKIVLPEPLVVPVAKVRKDFRETAFFFPAIYADSKGKYSFSFTMPEALTEWNWKMLAHTKKGQFVAADRKLTSQLTLMVQPNMPRLLYQGDELLLQSRISNLDVLEASGKVTCRVEDAVTGTDLTGVVLDMPFQSDFRVDAKSNVSSAFKLKVPETQLNPLKIIITATGGQFADAEEHVIPVMSKKIYVRQRQFLYFAAKDTTVQSLKLPPDADLYGLGLSVSAKPQAALLNSLPWLANYSFHCAEQIFNKFLANFTAYRLMKKDAGLGIMYSQANLADTVGQQQVLSEEQMQIVTPWLGLQDRNKHQQAQLLALLDTVRTKK